MHESIVNLNVPLQIYNYKQNIADLLNMKCDTLI